MPRKFHPMAELFPLMSNEELEELAADIATNGLLQDIVLHPNGQILDGRKRYLACLRAKIEPRFSTFDKDDDAVATDFVVSVNLHRRHLNHEQKRAVIATLLKTAAERSDRAIAKLAKVDLPEEAREPCDQSPALVHPKEDVNAGVVILVIVVSVKRDACARQGRVGRFNRRSPRHLRPSLNRACDQPERDWA